MQDLGLFHQQGAKLWAFSHTQLGFAIPFLLKNII